MQRRIAPSVAIEEVLLGELDDAGRLSELGRLGARLVFQRAVDDEVAAFLGRARYERTPDAELAIKRSGSAVPDRSRG